MANFKCRLCNQEIQYKFTKKIFNKNIKYFDCKNCALLQTEKPFWLEKAYKEPINKEDTGLLIRNIKLAIFVASFLKIFKYKDIKVLDYAGGYGAFTRLLRDLGFDAHWIDEYTQNLFAIGFEKKNIKYQIVTAFELLEHLKNPKVEIYKLLKNKELIIFTTELLKDPIDKNWHYFAPSHGQHVNFYRLKTLEYLGKKYKYNFYTNKINLHIFSKTKLNTIKIKFIYRFYIIYFLINYLTFKSRTFDDFQELTKT